MRKKNMQEDQEVLFFRDHFDEMMEWMEADKTKRDFAIPEEWDQDFRETMAETFGKKERKGKRQWQLRKSLRMAAAVVLAVSIGVGASTETVYGQGWLEVLQKTFDLKNKGYVTFDTNDGGQTLADMNSEEIFFSTESLDIAYEQIRQEMLMPMFYVEYFPEGYVLTEAKYDKNFQILNLKVENKERAIYILQQQVIDNNATGLIMGDTEAVVIENSNLDQKIEIYQSVQDETLVFGIQNSTMMMSFSGAITLDECKKVAESIVYK